MEIHKDSHLDHGLSSEQLLYIINKFTGRTGFFIETIQLPTTLGSVDCGLYGPTMGDDPVPAIAVAYAKRVPREYTSRVIVKPARKTQLVTVIAGPHDNLPCVLYTAFGGPKTPKEPNDPTLKPEEREESIAFWAEHALAVDAITRDINL
jgi:hypothetical protein